MHRLLLGGRNGAGLPIPREAKWLGWGGLQAALPGQGRALGEGEPSFFKELQSEPAELKGRKGAEGRAAAPGGLRKLRSSGSQPADPLRGELPAGKGKGRPRSAPLPTGG